MINATLDWLCTVAGATIGYAVRYFILQCYDVTEEHKAEVNALTTIEEVDAYEYKTDYPEKLSFEV